jgi:hypothetical protein
MDVQIEGDMAEVFRKIDATVKEQIALVLPTVLWHDSVRQSDGHPDRLNVKVVSMSSSPADLTQMRVRPFGKPSVKGAGADFLRPLLDANRNFRNAQAKVAVMLQKVWVMTINGKLSAGITWRAICVSAALAEQFRYTYDDVFGDDVFDEE